MILVSACLLGETVRYDGQRLKTLPSFPEAWRSGDRMIPFCPEIAGGLSVPRLPAELTGCCGPDVILGRGEVRNTSGEDVTAAFLAGARAAVAAARHHGAVMAILKERSPSCGSRFIYDGRFTGTLRRGQGVTAALLVHHGIAVFCENRIENACRFLDRTAGQSMGSPL
ncbi:MAG: DUF523 domain-containing protein [Desulfobacterales bacterium]|nr:DUF523 domain-containing protein [Desulfobacterales bacterium]